MTAKDKDEKNKMFGVQIKPEGDDKKQMETL